ncbi:MAG: alginate export family protein, partial [Planctomycetota bacterium]
KWEWDTRLYLKIGAEFWDGFKLFLQPQVVYIYTDLDSGGDTEFSQVDLYQAFLEYKKDSAGLKLGRQTLVYGDQRLLGHLGWKDISRTFDGVKGYWHKAPVKLDLFVVHPADIGAMSAAPSGSSSGESLVTFQDRWLFGAYGTYNFNPSLGVDLYFINWYHDDDASVAPERSVNTFGTRVFAKRAGFDATGEIVWQTGDWTKTVDQDAFALAVKAGYTFEKWKTRVGVEYDFSPGDDDPTGGDHEAFVFPFHTNHMHYGEMDFFSWANMRDLRFSLKTVPSPGLILFANVHFLELDEPEDNWLNVAGTGVVNPVFGPGDPSFDENTAGTEVDLKVVYKVKKYKGLKLVANYSVFLPGDAVEERNGGNDDNANFVYLIAQYAF